MKKFLVACGVAAMALGMASCDKGQSSSQADAVGSDSLAILMGESQGARFLEMWNQMPDSLKAKFDKDQFIAGMKSVLEHDLTDDNAFLSGVSVAMQSASEMQRLQSANVKFDTDVYLKAFAKAFKADSVDHAALAANNASLQVLMMQAQDAVAKKQQADQENARKQAEAAAQPNIKAGKEYVEKQKKADSNIKTTESGVSYKVEKEGAGAKPGKGDVVSVKYTGKHIDGTTFDSSNGEAREFNIAGVIPGFSEVLQMMAPGAKYVAYIPYDQGYGINGTGNIQPGETLVFEIEMVSVSPRNTPKPAASAAVESVKK